MKANPLALALAPTKGTTGPESISIIPSELLRITSYNVCYTKLLRNINPATSQALEEYRANVNLFIELARFVAAQGAFGQSAIIVAASGNESNRAEYEIAVSPPAAATGIVAVGALNKSDKGYTVAKFSNNP